MITKTKKIYTVLAQNDQETSMKIGKYTDYTYGAREVRG